MVFAIKIALFIIIVVGPIEPANIILTEMNHFDSCKGRSTGAVTVSAKYAARFFECWSIFETKYCQWRCVGLTVKIIDEFTQLIDRRGLEHFIQEFEEFPERHLILESAYECAKGKKLSVSHDCVATRETYRCFRKRFHQICKSEDNDTSVIPKYSRETVDLVSLIDEGD